MPFPEYIPTRMVSVGGAAVIESGQLLRTQVSIRASRSLIWGDTEYQLVSRTGATVTRYALVTAPPSLEFGDSPFGDAPFGGEPA